MTSRPKLNHNKQNRRASKKKTAQSLNFHTDFHKQQKQVLITSHSEHQINSNSEQRRVLNELKAEGRNPATTSPRGFFRARIYFIAFVRRTQRIRAPVKHTQRRTVKNKGKLFLRRRERDSSMRIPRWRFAVGCANLF